MNMSKPWFQLSPNEGRERWWRITELIDDTQKPEENDIECHFVIQDCGMCGNFWYISSWYVNCPNRYSSTVYDFDWFFKKKLNEISEGDIVCLLDNPHIQFKAYNSPHVFNEQRKFCKILVRI
jgi:hypothetical protein